MAYSLTGDFYLVVRKSGYYSLAARLTSKTPKSLEQGEVAIKLSVVVPDTLFKTPKFQAEVKIPESAVSSPVIDCTVLDNVREIIEQQTGMDIKLSLVENREDA